MVCTLLRAFSIVCLPHYAENGQFRSYWLCIKDDWARIYWSSVYDIDYQHVLTSFSKYSVILSVLDPRKCEYLKDYSLDFEHAYVTTYLASWEARRYLFAALWHPDVIGTTTGVWRYVAHSRVIVLCGLWILLAIWKSSTNLWIAWNCLVRIFSAAS